MFVWLFSGCYSTMFIFDLFSWFSSAKHQFLVYDYYVACGWRCDDDVNNDCDETRVALLQGKLVITVPGFDPILLGGWGKLGQIVL